MADTQQSTSKETLRSSEFRYLPCDAINLGISDNGVKLLLGVEEMDGATLELVGIHMTHRTAALLRAALAQALDHYQKETGSEIKVPDFTSKQAR